MNRSKSAVLAPISYSAGVNSYTALPLGKLFVIPARGPHKATIFMLHGLGSNPMPFMEGLKKHIPDYVRVVLPSAPSREVGIYGNARMPAWFNIRGQMEEDRRGVDESCLRLHELIDAEIKMGIHPRNIFIGGHSQGGAVSLICGLTYNRKLGGIFAISSFLPLHAHFPILINTAARDTPILMVNSMDDNIVPFKFGKMSAAVLMKHQLDVDFKTVNGAGHGINDAITKEFVAWLNQKLTQC
eukprot:GILK01013426.1.p1 GENE.GILK01013426.1~~GILK01013426.1.p1  ORF type:complete len:242 (-),score=44.13 GILK01013426.1:355-1080(-)